MVLTPGSGSPDTPAVAASQAGRFRPSEGEKKRTVDFVPFRAGLLPRGFTPHREWIFRGRHRTWFTDGMTWIEMAQSRAPADAEKDVVTQGVRCGRVSMTVVIDDVRLRLSGQIPPEELLAILETVSR